MYGVEYYITLLLLYKLIAESNSKITIIALAFSLFLTEDILQCVIILGSIIIMLWEEKGNYDILLLLGILGMFIMIRHDDLVYLYLGVELMSLSLYVLAGWDRDSQASAESGLKYYCLGALSTGIFLLGIALIYGNVGSTEYLQIYSTSTEVWGPYLIAVALLFKLASAPFHWWAPDVYEGAPLMITAYFSMIPKLATVIAISNIAFNEEITKILIVCSLLSICIGGLGAINQNNLKDY